jgi:hypothetical protein
LNEIIKQIKSMPLSQVAIIGKVVAERFASAAENLGEQPQAS